jgi:hypothetical protein
MKRVIKNNRCEVITKFCSIGLLGFALIFYLASIGSLSAASALLRGHDNEPAGDHARTRPPANIAEIEDLFVKGAHMKCGNRLWDFFMSPHAQEEENRALALMLASGQCDVSYDGAATTLSLKHPTSLNEYAGTFLKVLYSEDAKDDRITFNLVRFFDYLDRSQDPVGLDDDRNNRGNTVRNLAGLILKSQGHGPDGRDTLPLDTSNGALEEIRSMAANKRFPPAMAFLAQAYARQGNIVDSLYWDDLRARIHKDHESILLSDRSRAQLQATYRRSFYFYAELIIAFFGIASSALVRIYTDKDSKNNEAGKTLGHIEGVGNLILAVIAKLESDLTFFDLVIWFSPLAMPKAPPVVRKTVEDPCCCGIFSFC